MFTSSLDEMHVFPYAVSSFKVRLQGLSRYLFPVQVESHKIDVIMLKVKRVFIMGSAEGIVIHQSDN